MPLLEVTNGPTPPTGLTLTSGTKLVITYDRPYVDDVDSYPQVFRADYDVTNGTWKPEGASDGTAFYVAGAGIGDPIPPRVKISERQVYDGAESSNSYRELSGIYEDQDVAGTWDYGSLPEGWIPATTSSGGGIIVSGAEQLEDSGGGNVVTAAQARSHIDDTSNPHAVTAAQASAIPESDRGVASGVATLDADGFLDRSETRPQSIPWGMASTTDEWLSSATSDLGTTTLDNGRLFFSPLQAQSDIDAVRIEVTTAAASGGVIRIGVYNSNPSTLMPETLLKDFGTVDATTAGFKALTTSPVVPFERDEWFWIAVVAQGSPSTDPAVRCSALQGIQRTPLRAFYVAPAYSIYWSSVTAPVTDETTYTGVLPTSSPLTASTPVSDFWKTISAKQVMVAVRNK